MNPKGYRYTKENEWIFVESGNTGRVGITDYAQSHLGDIVFLELAPPATHVRQFGKIGEIESVKAVSELFTPVSGVVLAINQNAIDEPSLVNKDPYGDGWLIKLKLSDPAELGALMNSDEYDELTRYRG